MPTNERDTASTIAPKPPERTRLRNQNARTHGIYSAHPPDQHEVRMRLMNDLRDAIQRDDPDDIRIIARNLQAIGDRDVATALRYTAQQIEDDRAHRAGYAVPQRRSHIRNPKLIIAKWVHTTRNEHATREAGDDE